jgi:tetratricopeptide (TPR) repeat protein
MVAPRMFGKYTNNGFSLSVEYCKRGTFEADEGKLKEALQIFDEAINICPSNTIAYYNRATIKMDLGDIEGARRDFNLSRELIKINFLKD